MKKLPTGRGFLKWFFLNIITLGIYNLAVMYHISEEINQVAAKDGKKTMNYLLLFFLIGPELDKRGLGYKFGAGSFWGWCILGAIIVVGPCIYVHKLFKAMNKLNESYNADIKE